MEDGKFEITVDLDLKEIKRYEIVFYPKEHKRFIPGMVRVAFFVDSPNMSFEVVPMNGALQAVHFQGSPFNEKYNAIYGSLQSVKEYQRLQEEYANLKQQERNYQEALKCNVADIKDELLSLGERYNNSDVYATLVVMVCGDILTTEEFDEWYGHLVDSVKSNVYVQHLAEKFMRIKRNELGEKAFIFELPDTLGQMHKLSDFRGKYVLIDFWASWCGPCRMEIPNIERAAQKYKSKGLVVVGVSVDRKKEDWLKAVKEENVSYLQLLGAPTCGISYDFTTIPYIVLINPEGEIVAKKLRGEQIDKTLEVYLGNND